MALLSQPRLSHNGNLTSILGRLPIPVASNTHRIQVDLINSRFLVGSTDEPISAWEPVVVVASSKAEAIDRFLRKDYSTDATFR